MNRDVDINCLSVWTGNPRKHVDSQGIADLADSIRAVGVLALESEEEQRAVIELYDVGDNEFPTARDLAEAIEQRKTSPQLALFPTAPEPSTTRQQRNEDVDSDDESNEDVDEEVAEERREELQEKLFAIVEKRPGAVARVLLKEHDNADEADEADGLSTPSALRALVRAEVTRWLLREVQAGKPERAQFHERLGELKVTT